MILRSIGEPKARLIEGDGAETRLCESGKIAQEDVRRGAERAAVKKEHDRAASSFDITMTQAIDRHVVVLKIVLRRLHDVLHGYAQ
jgi:hypothetical protein